MKLKSRKILHGQTLIDISVQELGEPERVMELAVLNNLSVTGAIQGLDPIEIPSISSQKRRVVQLFVPPTSPSSIDDELPTVAEGIGAWAIENDFIVQ